MLPPLRQSLQKFETYAEISTGLSRNRPRRTAERNGSTSEYTHRSTSDALPPVASSVAVAGTAAPVPTASPAGGLSPREESPTYWRILGCRGEVYTSGRRTSVEDAEGKTTACFTFVVAEHSN